MRRAVSFLGILTGLAALEVGPAEAAAAQRGPCGTMPSDLIDLHGEPKSG